MFALAKLNTSDGK
jgi:hypothetical protein